MKQELIKIVAKIDEVRLLVFAYYTATLSLGFSFSFLEKKKETNKNQDLHR